MIGFDFNPSRTSRKQAFTPMPRRIRTDREQEFSFYASLEKPSQGKSGRSNLSHWETIVRRCAVNAIESKVDGERTEALGGIAARWSGGVEGEGERVFSAWTRTNWGLFVLFPATICFIPLLGPLVGFFLLRESIHPLMLVLPVVTALTVVIGRKTLKAVRVKIGKDGIAYLRPWRKDVLTWEAIERVEQEGHVTTLHSTSGSVVRFNISALAYGSQIAPLIDERLRDAGLTVAKESKTAAREASVADR